MLNKTLSFFLSSLILATLALTPAVCPNAHGAESFHALASTELEGNLALRLCTTEPQNNEESNLQGDCAWSCMRGINLLPKAVLVSPSTFVEKSVFFFLLPQASEAQALAKSGRAPPLFS